MSDNIPSRDVLNHLATEDIGSTTRPQSDMSPFTTQHIAIRLFKLSMQRHNVGYETSLPRVVTKTDLHRIKL